MKREQLTLGGLSFRGATMERAAETATDLAAVPVPSIPPALPETDAPEVEPAPAMATEPEDALALEVNSAMSTVGYGWAGGVVLTSVDDERAQTVIALNPGNGAYIAAIDAWVSWCTPTGGLVLPPDTPIAPGFGSPATQWASLHAHVVGDHMVVVACDVDGHVVYVMATARSKEFAPMLALAALRVIEDTDLLPRSFEDAVRNPSNMWVNGWTLEKADLVDK